MTPTRPWQGSSAFSFPGCVNVAKQIADITDIKLPYIVEDKLILKVGRWNGKKYSEKEVRAALDDLKQAPASAEYRNKTSLVLDHEDGTLTWVGDIDPSSVRWDEKAQGIRATLRVTHEDTARNIEFQRQRGWSSWGLSPRMDVDLAGASRDEVTNIRFKSIALVLEPAGGDELFLGRDDTASIGEEILTERELEEEELEMEIGERIEKLEKSLADLTTFLKKKSDEEEAAKKKADEEAAAKKRAEAENAEHCPYPYGKYPYPRPFRAAQAAKPEDEQKPGKVKMSREALAENVVAETAQGIRAFADALDAAKGDKEKAASVLEDLSQRLYMLSEEFVSGEFLRRDPKALVSLMREHTKLTDDEARKIELALSARGTESPRKGIVEKPKPTAEERKTMKPEQRLGAAVDSMWSRRA